MFNDNFVLCYFQKKETKVKSVNFMLKYIVFEFPHVNFFFRILNAI